MAEADYPAIIEHQHAMNDGTWTVLAERGVSEQTTLRLDFFFYAPDKDAADSLVSLLRGETDYDVRPPQYSGPFFRKKWSVSGATQETHVSLDILNQWVAWMVMAGKRSKGCNFDGWGTEIRA